MRRLVTPQLLQQLGALFARGLDAGGFHVPETADVLGLPCQLDSYGAVARICHWSGRAQHRSGLPPTRGLTTTPGQRLSWLQQSGDAGIADQWHVARKAGAIFPCRPQAGVGSRPLSGRVQLAGDRHQRAACADFAVANRLAAREMGTAKFEPEKSDRTAKFTPITFPLASNTGPPDPP